MKKLFAILLHVWIGSLVTCTFGALLYSIWISDMSIPKQLIFSSGLTIFYTGLMTIIFNLPALWESE